MRASKLKPNSISLCHLFLIFLFFFISPLPILSQVCPATPKSSSAYSSPSSSPLRFGTKNGEFKILQVADMHYADGKTSPCLDVLPNQVSGCSDLNTSAFIHRMIQAEKPDLIVFTGDNIFGFDATDAVKSLNTAIAPAISSGIPWAAVLGNHDQESTLSREGVMKHIVSMQHTLAQLNPSSAEVIDGFGNYNLEVGGVEGSSLQNKSILNLYFLDSGDYSTVPSIPGYGWIKASQQFWFQQTSLKLQKAYMNKPKPQKTPAPGLAYFHIPLPEYASFDSSNFTGVKQEGISSASVNSGFFTTMVEAGDVKAVFTGHDHVNDFCGELTGIHLCYAGGFGYHAYGKAGWSRRARVVLATLEKTEKGGWGAVKSIRTWKRLDDENLTAIDAQVLWTKSSANMDFQNCAVRVDSLTGSNYSTWKRQITLQLGLLDFDFVLTEARPVVPTAESTDVEKATFKKWEKINKLCMMVIRGSIHETISGGIPETTTVKELFELINKQFMGTVHSRQYNCLAQLFSLYCDETGSVREHILKLSKLVINLRDLGFTIADELMVHMAVAKLPSKFDTLKVNYSTQ